MFPVLEERLEDKFIINNSEGLGKISDHHCTPTCGGDVVVVSSQFSRLLSRSRLRSCCWSCRCLFSLRVGQKHDSVQYVNPNKLIKMYIKQIHNTFMTTKNLNSEYLLSPFNCSNQ